MRKNDNARRLLKGIYINVKVWFSTWWLNKNTYLGVMLIPTLRLNLRFFSSDKVNDERVKLLAASIVSRLSS